jgi:hypothetical protein
MGPEYLGDGVAVAPQPRFGQLHFLCCLLTENRKSGFPVIIEKAA